MCDTHANCFAAARRTIRSRCRLEPVVLGFGKLGEGEGELRRQVRVFREVFASTAGSQAFLAVPPGDGDDLLRAPLPHREPAAEALLPCSGGPRDLLDEAQHRVEVAFEDAHGGDPCIHGCIWRVVQLAQRGCAPQGLPVYPQGDGARFCFGYGFYRNGVVLLAQAHESARGDLHEPEPPVVVHVDVGHAADEVATRVEDAPLAQLALRGSRVLGKRKAAELHGVLSVLYFGGKKGALLTACCITTQCGQEPSGRPCGRFSANRAEGGTHHPGTYRTDYAELFKREAIHPSA